MFGEFSNQSGSGILVGMGSDIVHHGINKGLKQNRHPCLILFHQLLLRNACDHFLPEFLNKLFTGPIGRLNTVHGLLIVHIELRAAHLNLAISIPGDDECFARNGRNSKIPFGIFSIRTISILTHPERFSVHEVE